jgi:hypothetical protein
MGCAVKKMRHGTSSHVHMCRNFVGELMINKIKAKAIGYSRRYIFPKSSHLTGHRNHGHVGLLLHSQENVVVFLSTLILHFLGVKGGEYRMV